MPEQSACVGLAVGAAVIAIFSIRTHNLLSLSAPDALYEPSV